MSRVNQLKNKARGEEQRENWSKAIELYTQALDASRKEGEAFADLSLYNRIGDIYLRIGQKNTAVRYYEQAIERYAEQDLHTSAIALCNKVLRIHPTRSTIFLQLGRLNLATNLIADARSHYHRYAEAMRERGTIDAALDGLEELIGETGDARTIEMWTTWLSEMPDRDEAFERLEEIRSTLIGHGIDPDSIVEQVETGEIAGVDVDPSAELAHDPLAGAFLTSEAEPEPEASELAEALEDIEPAEVVEELEVVADFEAVEEREAVEELEVETGAADEEPAVLDMTAPADEPDPEPVIEEAVPLELGSNRWDDEAEELLAELNRPIEAAWASVDSESSASPAPAPDGISELAEAEGNASPAFDAAHERPDPDDAEPVETAVNGSAPPVPWSDDADPSETAPEPSRDAVAPAAHARESAEPPARSDAPVLEPRSGTAPETVEPMALDHPFDVGEIAALAFENREFDEAVEWGARDAFAGFDPEPPVLEDEIPEPEGEEPAEPDLDSFAAAQESDSTSDAFEEDVEPAAEPEPAEVVESAPEVAAEGEEVDSATGDAWAAEALAGLEPEAEKAEETESEADEAWATEALSALEPETEKAEETEAETDDGWASEALAALEAAAAEPEPEAVPEPESAPEPESEPAGEPESVTPDAASPDRGAVFEALESLEDVEVAPEPQPDPEGDIELAIEDEDDDELPYVKNPFAPPSLPEEERRKAAERDLESETLTVETSTVSAEAAEPPAAPEVPAAAAEPPAADSVIETPEPVEPEPEPVAVDIEPEEPEPIAATAQPPATEPVSEARGDEMSAPLAESRLVIEEDPEDSFRDWVESASTGVLKRALPELENRSEDDKALLVIRRLAHLEESGVEFKNRLVNHLEKLGRVEPAAAAAMALGTVLESDGRLSDARSAYQRALRIRPGYEEASVAVERLGDVTEEHGEEAAEVGSRPYMPDHVSASPDTTVLDPPRPASSTNGFANGEAGPRPYSGVSGGAEASADFEQLLSEFRAELHHKPSHSDSSSRTELGANLKEMGRLDDAIRELQAAVREPSPPPLAFELLGEAFLEKGQGRIAVRLLEKALGTLGLGDRELMGVLYQLGVAYESLTERNKALMCYERIFSVDIDYRDIQERILDCTS